MRRFATLVAITVLFAGSACAAKAVIALKSGKNLAAHSVQGESVSGIIWNKERNRPGRKIQIWDLVHVQYSVKGGDDYRGLARDAAGGRGDTLRKKARNVLDDLDAGVIKNINDTEETNIRLGAKYYLARARLLLREHQGAIDAFIDYMKDAEAATADISGSYIRGVSFKSVATGTQVTQGGALHRLYLDALEGLGQSYVGTRNPSAANSKAYKPLRDLCHLLASKSGKKQYYDWSIRANKARAEVAESAKDFKAARDAYEDLNQDALRKSGGKGSREASEARLKVGFLLVKMGKLTDATSRFRSAIKDWEKALKVGRSDWKPRTGWIDSDVAYLTSGSYVGVGLVISSRAGKDAEKWAKALRNFSASLAVFSADSELRSMGLLGAANASAQLARSVKEAKIAARHAKMAEKYLAELQSTLPKTRAASDESISDIEKLIRKHRAK